MHNNTDMRKKHTLTISYIFENLSVAVGIVLIWRGVWYILDGVDALLFGGSHIWSSVLGIFIGLIILYIPDKDLKELGRL